ncbi:hypothetical protein CPC08DRAFT_773455 [Agrocybe pediades]|nr:hypothetical protein CPC08DRAFT_773455 [Agrocybe pediades]
MEGDALTLRKQLCTGCYKKKEVNDATFKKTRDGFSRTCLNCLRKRASSYRAGKGETKQDKENKGFSRQFDADRSRLGDESDELGHSKELKTISVEEFLATLSKFDGVFSFSASVELSGLNGSSVRERLDDLAMQIWQMTNYRFIYHGKRLYKTSPATKYSYHCAQLQIGSRPRKPRKSTAVDVKNRNKPMMETFPCEGWLIVTANDDGSGPALVKLKHHHRHVFYWNVDFPEHLRHFKVDTC